MKIITEYINVYHSRPGHPGPWLFMSIVPSKDYSIDTINQELQKRFPASDGFGLEYIQNTGHKVMKLEN